MRHAIGIAAVLTLLASAPNAWGGYYSYAEWERLAPGARATYMAGAYDMLTGAAVHPADHAMAEHYGNCVQRAKFDTGQLADNVLYFARGRPDLHDKPAIGALINYLIAVCGTPPSRP